METAKQILINLPSTNFFEFLKVDIDKIMQIFSNKQSIISIKAMQYFIKFLKIYYSENKISLETPQFITIGYTFLTNPNPEVIEEAINLLKIIFTV